MAARRNRSTVPFALIVLAVLVSALGCGSTTGPSSEDRPPEALPWSEAHNGAERAAHRQDERLSANVPGEMRDWHPSSALGAADGDVPDGTTVFADIPAVSNLDPALLAALRQAASAAAGDGVELDVNSGWRSSKYQEQLFEEAVAKYGSEAKAERWVARPGTSVHEAGGAVDIGPSSALTWLARHGAAFGLCQIYGNEPWHYELRPDAIAHGCPTTYIDPPRDPRMQQ
jgi:hypothetical protein